MKRVLATIVSALVTLAFAGLAAAQQPYATDTHPPIINEQPAAKGQVDTKEVKKAKKKKKKAKKAKKQQEDMGTMQPAPNTTAPTPPATPPPAQ